MKKNIRYLVLLIALLVAVYFLVFKNKMSTLSGKDNDFAVKDTASINKIFLASMNGRSITLERGENHWLMNKSYPVRNDEMNILLATIKDVAVKYPIANAAHNNVIKNLSGDAIKVEIYDKKNSMIKSYYVGGADPDERGTYMMMPNSDNPYATYIPGFEGYLTSRYSIDADAWRDRTIFDYDIPEIFSITVNYNDERKDSSFEVDVLRSDSFQIKPLYAKTITKPVEKEKLFLYAMVYKNVNAEGYANDNSSRDSLLQTVPFCVITLTDRAGNPHVVKCYHKKITERSMQQFNNNGQPLPYDLDHYYASINNGKDFVLIQQFHFGRLFKTYHYFFTPIAAPLKH